MAFEIKIRPIAERKELIEQRLKVSTEFGDPVYDFRGDVLRPKVVSLPIDLLVYRMENCRTFSAQQSEISSGKRDFDFFDKGQELSSAQQVQHSILSKLSKEGSGSVTPIISVLSDDGQREAILITHSGVVVNGNRRLSAMRELYRASDGSVDERFSHVKCAVLPADTTRDEIDDIEADLQARPQTKLDYDWIGDARLIRRQVSKGRSPKEVADRLKRSKQDIENVLQALDEADLYLAEWVDKPGRYELVAEEGKQIFGDIPKSIARKEVALQDASRAIAWSLFENRSRVSGRIYNLNPAFGKLAPQVLSLFADNMDIPMTVRDVDGDTEEFEFEIDDDESATDYSTLIGALKDEATKDDAFMALLDAAESAIELEKGQKNEKAALRALSQAHSKLTGVDVVAAGESTLAPMRKQVEAIRAALDNIDEQIEKRLAAKAGSANVHSE
ncbi:hypothetical protein AWH62_12730 [Maricaulis sp. W15]|uniref:hypothetical protein n=1 Tax=Maricaulis sp. W15 TaxID=1772333 RepID=UPI0009490140|nr:hypothetical protein [Maricaulis sp. W15]OLF71405.1 hypothetical protein AWH62_12730 [Maricaulis sp. W15]